MGDDVGLVLLKMSLIFLLLHKILIILMRFFITTPATQVCTLWNQLSTHHHLPLHSVSADGW